MIAARNGHAEITAQLIAAKADIKARTEKGNSALKFATKKGHVETAEIIKKALAEKSLLAQQSLLAEKLLFAEKSHLTEESLLTEESPLTEESLLVEESPLTEGSLEIIKMKKKLPIIPPLLIKELERILDPGAPSNKKSRPNESTQDSTKGDVKEKAPVASGTSADSKTEKKPNNFPCLIA